MPRPRRRACARCSARSAIRSASSTTTCSRIRRPPARCPARRCAHARCSTCRRSATSKAATGSAFISAPSAGSRASTTTTPTAIRCSRRRSPARRPRCRRAAVRGLLWRYRWFTLGVIAAHPLAGGQALGRSACRTSPSRNHRCNGRPDDDRSTLRCPAARRRALAARPTGAAVLRAARAHGIRRADADHARRHHPALRPGRTRPSPRATCRRPTLRCATGIFAATCVTGGDIAFAEAYMDGRWDTPTTSRAAHRASRSTSARSSARSTAAGGGSSLSPQAPAASNSKRRARTQHRRALRSGQRFLLALARSDDDVFGGAVRQATAAARSPTRSTRSTRVSWSELRAAARRACSRDRVRLGRLCRNRSARRASRHRDQSLPTSRPRTRARALPRAGSRSRRIPDPGLPRCARHFDGIASIEMFEAVGERYWPTYFQAVQQRAEARRTRGAADDHDRRRPLRAVPADQRLHPAVHFPRRHARLAVALRRRGRAAWGSNVDARASLRPRLRGDAAALARRVRRQCRCRARAGVQPEVHSLLALLPRLLRRRLCERDDRCRAVHACRCLASLTRRGCLARRPPPSTGARRFTARRCRAAAGSERFAVAVSSRSSGSRSTTRTFTGVAGARGDCAPDEPFALQLLYQALACTARRSPSAASRK